MEVQGVGRGIQEDCRLDAQSLVAAKYPSTTEPATYLKSQFQVRFRHPPQSLEGPQEQ
jgi:hypothetical protein